MDVALRRSSRCSGVAGSERDVVEALYGRLCWTYADGEVGEAAPGRTYSPEGRRAYSPAEGRRGASTDPRRVPRAVSTDVRRAVSLSGGSGLVARFAGRCEVDAEVSPRWLAGVVRLRAGGDLERTVGEVGDAGGELNRVLDLGYWRDAECGVGVSGVRGLSRLALRDGVPGEGERWRAVASDGEDGELRGGGRLPGGALDNGVGLVRAESAEGPLMGMGPCCMLPLFDRSRVGEASAEAVDELAGTGGRDLGLGSACEE